MPPDEQRENVWRGMRVKVRFDDNVWYGGSITGVLSLDKIKIEYDDGTEEVSDFPDNDIVIDIQNDGSHCVNAKAFVPLRARTSPKNPRADEIEVGKGCPPGGPISFAGKHREHAGQCN